MAKEEKNIKNIIESLLLVAEKPISVKEMAECAGAIIAETQKTLLTLTDEYKDRGIRITKKGDYFSMVTAPENAEAVSRYLNEELRHDLSNAAIEALSIITYKQPITRIEIEEIRGVDSSQIVRNLMIRGLIAEVGRKEAPGRPILYGTTMEFLQYFGLNSEADVPKFDITPQEVMGTPELFQEVDTINVNTE